VRSASLIRTTRMSSTIASSILRRFSACAARSCLSLASEVARIDPMRATPATSVATSAPNCTSTASASKLPAMGSPSSSAARIESGSSFSAARIVAVPTARSSAPSPSAVAASSLRSCAYANARDRRSRSCALYVEARDSSQAATAAGAAACGAARRTATMFALYVASHVSIRGHDFVLDRAAELESCADGCRALVTQENASPRAAP